MIRQWLTSYLLCIAKIAYIQLNLHNSNSQGTTQNCSSYGKFELWELIWKEDGWKGPEKSVRVIESSSHGSSSYRGSAVSKEQCHIIISLACTTEQYPDPTWPYYLLGGATLFDTCFTFSRWCTPSDKLCCRKSRVSPSRKACCFARMFYTIKSCRLQLNIWTLLSVDNHYPKILITLLATKFLDEKGFVFM